MPQLQLGELAVCWGEGGNQKVQFGDQLLLGKAAWVPLGLPAQHLPSTTCLSFGPVSGAVCWGLLRARDRRKPPLAFKDLHASYCCGPE